MKRKFMCLLCVFALMAAMLGGCGKASEEKPANGSQSAEDPKRSEESQPEESQAEEGAAADVETGAEELEYVELNWYVTSNAKDVDLIQAALDEYFLEKLNCKVILHCVEGGWDTYADTVSPKLMAGDDDIDICTLLQSVPYLSYASMGALYPVDTLWDEHGQNVKGLFSEGVWDSLKVDGHIYAVPILKDNAYIIGYIYNF